MHRCSFFFLVTWLASVLADNLRGDGGANKDYVPLRMTGGSSASDDVFDDPYKMLVVAAIAVSTVSVFLSVVAVCLLCKVMGIHRRLNGRAVRDLPVSTEPGVELANFGRGSSAGRGNDGEEEFLSFCDEDGGDATQIRRASQVMGNYHGVAFAGHGEVDFTGTWECVETWGLDEFLVAMGVGRLRRMAASKAPWPSWQFTHKGNEITYVNKSKFGVMTEAFKVDGSEYQHKDLEKNVTTCKARLEGPSLIIERQGKEHKNVETRTIKNGDTMDFVLKMEGIDKTWGRRFTRKSRK